jgi:hypothetical protein
MPHEIDVDFQQDLPSYLNALEQYNIQYGPKPQNLQGFGDQNFQVRTSDFAPGYGYVNPQNNELFPLYPETGGFEQPNPGLVHLPPSPLPTEEPPAPWGSNYVPGYTDYGEGGMEIHVPSYGYDRGYTGYGEGGMEINVPSRGQMYGPGSPPQRGPAGNLGW